jgi:hypothetical protein
MGVAVTWRTSAGGGTWVAARVRFSGEIGMGLRGEVQLSLNRGVGGVQKD